MIKSTEKLELTSKTIVITNGTNCLILGCFNTMKKTILLRERLSKTLLKTLINFQGMWDIIRCTLQCKTEILWTYLRHRIQLSSPKLKSKLGKKWERTKLRCWTTLKIHKISTLAKKKPTLILIWIVCLWGKGSKRSKEEQSHSKKASLPRPKN